MGVKSIPSRIIYTADVPEVTNLKTEFVYKYYVTNECVKDKDILTDDAIKSMNISQDIISKTGSEIAEKYLDYAEKKFPRYVKSTFKRPSIPYSAIKDLITKNFNKIVDEQKFSSNYFTSLNFSNGNIDKNAGDIFKESSKITADSNTKKDGVSVNSYQNIKNSIGSSNINVVSNIFNQQELMKGTVFRSGEGKKNLNLYFEKIKGLNFYSQINNNVLFDLTSQGSNSTLNVHKQALEKVNKTAKSLIRSNGNFDLTEDEFKPSVPYYKITTNNVDVSSPVNIYLAGYVIEKVELFSDGTQKNHEPIIIENGGTSSFLDLNVRYGTVYLYKVKSIVNISFPAIENSSANTSMISSLISSKPVSSYVETTENLGPPPPTNVKFVWNYDRVNPSTAMFDPNSNKPYPNTGIRGSLMIYWSFPINPQMDIKKFQIFRRKKINEPFELIKVFDFADGSVVFPDLEETINQSLIEKTLYPECSYYDDDFLKKSEYIYAVAAIDAHGLTSNYSEQFKVSFDAYKNKIEIKLVSVANCPKQYPNLYVQQDLFIDTIKTSNKKTMHVYFSPDCYNVINGSEQLTNVLNSSKFGSSYKMNFINIENQKSCQLNINIDDLRTVKAKSKVSSNNFNLKS